MHHHFLNPLFFLILLVSTLFYFAPSFVAFHRRHPQRISILVLNSFWGFTVLGWAVALVWAEAELKQAPETPAR